MSLRGSRYRKDPFRESLGDGVEVKGKRSMDCLPQICECDVVDGDQDWSCGRVPCPEEARRVLDGGNLRTRVHLVGRGSRSSVDTRRKRWRWEGSRIGGQPYPEGILSFQVALHWVVGRVPWP